MTEGQDAAGKTVRRKGYADARGYEVRTTDGPWEDREIPHIRRGICPLCGDSLTPDGRRPRKSGDYLAAHLPDCPRRESIFDGP